MLTLDLQLNGPIHSSMQHLFSGIYFSKFLLVAEMLISNLWEIIAGTLWMECTKNTLCAVLNYIVNSD